MTKEECEQMITGLNLPFVPIEFPEDSGMYIFIQALNDDGELE